MYYDLAKGVSPMSPLSLFIMSFSMSADAFAVSISKGVRMKTPNIREAIKVGFLFGIVEATTPIIGWAVGSAASGFIESIDHWICFGILAVVGGKMIYESFQESSSEEENEISSSKKNGKLGLLILTAVGTSIDAMAVGVSLAFLDVNIWVAAASIGAATTLMVFIGTMAGHYLGAKAGKYAEALGGIALITVGSHILLSHLGYI